MGRPRLERPSHSGRPNDRLASRLNRYHRDSWPRYTLGERHPGLRDRAMAQEARESGRLAA